MRVRFLLGPAGSGKTFRCVAEIGQALRAAPEGPPLLFLAPKQATFQLERQVLESGAAAGYARLRVLSFPRLAELVLARAGRPGPPLLSEDGRLMVLRALLAQRRDELRLFHATARLPGLAQQLSDLLRDLQHHKLTPAQLEELARRVGQDNRLGDKLHDLALLLRAYLEWLASHQLQDADCLLDRATEVLSGTARAAPSPPDSSVGGLWLDSFAEMTPHELDLLTALLPQCAQATLAFCLDIQAEARAAWTSAWSLVGRTYDRLLDRVSGLPGVSVAVEQLPRGQPRTRFTGNPVLERLERGWTAPPPPPGPPLPAGPAGGAQASPPVPPLAPSLCLFACANPDAEAVVAAREVLRFVRDRGGRFRETAVLARSLGDYHHALRRVFARYDIPFFLDRRESVAHHPVAELTRYAVRTVAYGWQHEDWFGALKTGLIHADETIIDRLENEALARGWTGPAWQAPLAIEGDAELAEWVERARLAVVTPFRRFEQHLLGPADGGRGQPSGARLARALRALWAELRVEDTLGGWSDAPPTRPEAAGPAARQVHATVWEQINDWLDNLERAFPSEPLELREWLPILEAGLANLSVGVIPPALDQVTLGAIDRSRNPELRLVVVMGMNETVFPAPPPPPPLLTESDRARLNLENVELGLGTRHFIARERYYAYIACTRARERLVLTCARRDARDRALNPSPFIAHLQRLFPGLELESAPATSDWTLGEHRCELIPALLEGQDAGSARRGGGGTVGAQRAPAGLAEAVGALPMITPAGPHERLLPAVAEALYGPTLKTSVSRLEQFAACPFKFFAQSGLGAEEREQFVIDWRQRGSFQHLILAQFHQAVSAEGRVWRDLTPIEARERIARVAEQEAVKFGAGLFQADDQSLFTAHSLSLALQDFIEIIVTWMRESYHFNPRAVELPFGGKDALLPAWELDLGDGHRMAFRGVIDRVDMATDPGTGQCQCVVLDYKSSARKVEPVLMEHGIQMQLPAYLAALRRLPGLEAVLGTARPAPTGVFYVALRGAYERGTNREEVRTVASDARRDAFQHRGRFRIAALPLLDSQSAQGGQSRQFSCPPTGKPSGNYHDPMTDEEFEAMLDGVENRLRLLGRGIFAGVAKVDPYFRSASDIACHKCDYRAICRIDPWAHAYRRLEGARPRAAEPASPAD